jgi:hypothetical protein
MKTLPTLPKLYPIPNGIKGNFTISGLATALRQLHYGGYAVIVPERWDAQGHGYTRFCALENVTNQEVAKAIAYDTDHEIRGATLVYQNLAHCDVDTLDEKSLANCIYLAGALHEQDLIEGICGFLVSKRHDRILTVYCFRLDRV